MTSKFAAFTNKFDEIREKLQKQKIEQETNKQKGSFDNSWKFAPDLPKDKPKITYKVRILPNVHNQEAVYPWISAPFHMFRKPDGKFIYTLCPSLNDNKEKKEKAPCPFCEKASALFKTQDKMDEDYAHKMYKKNRFFLNVLVLEDPRTGEENQKGKVLVYEYGKKVQEKLEDALIEQKIDFVNPLAGHDFNLVIKRQGEFTNYDSSTFSMEKTAISKDEEELNKIFDSIHNLKDKVLGRGPQTYEKLTQMLTAVAAPKVDETVDATETIDDVPDKAVSTQKAQPKVEKEEKKVEKKTESAKTPAADDDFDFNFDEK
jgi:hypothetical protein